MLGSQKPYLPWGAPCTSKHCLATGHSGPEGGSLPLSRLTAGIEYFLMEMDAFSLINKPFVWEPNGSPISGLLMDDVFVYTHKANASLCPPSLSNPSPAGVHPLPEASYLAAPGRSTVVPAHLASLRGTERFMYLSLPTSSLLQCAPNKGAFSLPT